MNLDYILPSFLINKDLFTIKEKFNKLRFKNICLKSDILNNNNELNFKKRKRYLILYESTYTHIVEEMYGYYHSQDYEFVRFKSAVTKKFIILERKGYNKVWCIE